METRNPRVVMITPNFHPHVGGSERQALELSKALRVLGVSITVLTQWKSGLAKTESIEGIGVKRLWAPGSGLIASFGFMIATFAWLWEHSSEWDAAHVHLAGSQALSAALAGKLLMRPAFVKIGGGRGIGEIAVSSRTVFGRLKLKALRWLKPGWVAVTQDLADELKEHGFDSAVQVIPNGVDTRRFRPASAQQKRQLRAELSWPEQALCLLYVGRLAPEKRLESLVQALSEMRAEASRPIFFVLAGDGPEHDRLEREVRGTNLESNVRFQPPIGSVERLYQAADAFVLPSISEGLSNALLEAMSCGLPVLASRVGGTAETVEDGKSGILFAPMDLEGIRQGLKRLMQSPQEAEAMGGRAREKVEAGFGIDKIAQRYLNLYRS